LQDLLQNAPVEQIAQGIQHWKAVHPNLGIDVSSYWLPDLGLLLDPIAVPDEVEDVECILLTCRHHVRDSLEAAERFGATIQAPRTGMHDFPDDTPIQPYNFGDSLVGGAVRTHEVGGLSPDETALHIPSVNALSIADGAIRYGDELAFVPDQYMDDPEQDKADLKRGFGELADQLDFDVLLLAHGTPYPSGGRDALRRFAES
jgi:glyoxylase-like metal-dependent hydrolase (beta-lactamase superfamily II)